MGSHQEIPVHSNGDLIGISPENSKWSGGLMGYAG